MLSSYRLVLLGICCSISAMLRKRLRGESLSLYTVHSVSHVPMISLGAVRCGLPHCIVPEQQARDGPEQDPARNVPHSTARSLRTAPTVPCSSRLRQRSLVAERLRSPPHFVGFPRSVSSRLSAQGVPQVHSNNSQLIRK